MRSLTKTLAAVALALVVVLGTAAAIVSVAAPSPQDEADAFFAAAEQGKAGASGMYLPFVLVVVQVDTPVSEAGVREIGKRIRCLLEAQPGSEGLLPEQLEVWFFVLTQAQFDAGPAALDGNADVKVTVGPCGKGV